ncbi:MAG: sulfur acceptor protein SufE for iron-sulfur cluster assembly [Cellvibrio sp. 79]|nr:MAG: sulfur acceptor protein SufE for iron-sulfur cluster assembly [Cellvibrio sp. 79]
MQHDDLSSISISRLLAADNWQQQYKLIIQWGKLLSPKPEIRTAENLIRGCELPVWLTCTQCAGKLYFSFDADSSVIKGLAALLLVQINDKTLVELADLDLAESLQLLGLEKHLTPSRSNGFNGIISRVYELLKVADKLF